jgi:hypothetical protein
MISDNSATTTLLKKSLGYNLLITLSSLLCLVALLEDPLDLDLSYGYYQFLKWVVSAAAGWACYRFFKADLSVRAVFAFLIAALFNPIRPIDLDLETWLVIDAVVMVLLPSLHLFKHHKKRFEWWTTAAVFAISLIWLSVYSYLAYLESIDRGISLKESILMNLHLASLVILVVIAGFVCVRLLFSFTLFKIVHPSKIRSS